MRIYYLYQMCDIPYEDGVFINDHTVTTDFQQLKTIAEGTEQESGYDYRLEVWINGKREGIEVYDTKDQLMKFLETNDWGTE